MNSLEVHISKLLNLVDCNKRLAEHLPFWTQAQGSNLSYKDKSTHKLWIKPSGFRLDQVDSIEKLVLVDLTKLPKSWAQISDKDYSSAISASKIESAKNNYRPSMETGFHAALNADFVFHFHSLAAFFMSLEKEKYLIWLNKHFKFGSIHFCEYKTPGLDLTLEISKHPNGSLFILKNHGVCLACEEPAVLDHWLDLEKKFMAEFFQTSWPLEKNEVLKISQSGPLKVLFPDMAVFLNKIQTVLEPHSGQYSLRKGAEISDKNLYEIWAATQILLKFAPDLETLSETEVQKITGLPTEQYRMMMKF